MGTVWILLVLIVALAACSPTLRMIATGLYAEWKAKRALRRMENLIAGMPLKLHAPVAERKFTEEQICEFFGVPTRVLPTHNPAINPPLSADELQALADSAPPTIGFYPLPTCDHELPDGPARIKLCVKCGQAVWTVTCKENFNET